VRASGVGRWPLRVDRAPAHLPCLLLGAMLPALAGCAKPLEISPQGDVLVEGVRVPARFGAYTLDDVEEFDAQEYGSAVRYLPEDSVSATMPMLDLFVYPSDRSPLATHAEQQRRELQIAGAFVRDAHLQVDELSRTPPPRGVNPIYVVPLRIISSRGDMRSMMYLSRVGDRNLKVRATWPAAAVGLEEVVGEQVRILIGDIVRREDR